MHTHLISYTAHARTQNEVDIATFTHINTHKCTCLENKKHSVGGPRPSSVMTCRWFAVV